MKNENHSLQETKPTKPKQMNMTIDGHKVTISIAQEYNPTLAELVRTTLLDAYIKKNALCTESTSA